MKYLVIFLVFFGITGLAYAEHDEPKVPEPMPSCPEGTILKDNTCIETVPICGEGTTYQDGICVVNESNEKTNSEKWTNSFQNISKTPRKHETGTYENTGVFYSKNGTELVVLKKGQEVDIIFQYEFRNDKIFDGYVYYNIAENGNLISQSQNFIISEIPKVFKFTYTPQNVGEFSFTKGSISHSGTWGGEQGRSIIVLEEFSKAMKFNGQCKKPFPKYTLAVKHDFSTAACVKYDTKQKLIERGWAENNIQNIKQDFFSKYGIDYDGLVVRNADASVYKTVRNHPNQNCFTLTDDMLNDFPDGFLEDLKSATEEEFHTDPQIYPPGIYTGYAMLADKDFALDFVKKYDFNATKQVFSDNIAAIPDEEYQFDCFFDYYDNQYMLRLKFEQQLHDGNFINVNITRNDQGMPIIINDNITVYSG